jgi:hypothetical protein
MAGLDVSRARVVRAHGMSARRGELRALLVAAADSARRVRRVELAHHADALRGRRTVRERVRHLFSTIEPVSAGTE